MTDAMAQGWYADPDGAHELRFHDGSGWTVHVANEGVMTQVPRGGVPAARPGPGAGGRGAGPERGRQLALRYGEACTAVLDTAQAALAIANDAAGAWNMARQRPQHEISIQTFTRLAQEKQAEFGPAFTAFQAAAGAAREAGSKLRGHYADRAEAETILALSLTPDNFSEVGAAIEYLRVTFPPDALGFRDMIPQVNHAVNTSPGFGQPGFQGNVYSDGRADGANRL